MRLSARSLARPSGDVHPGGPDTASKALRRAVGSPEHPLCLAPQVVLYVEGRRPRIDVGRRRGAAWPLGAARPNVVANGTRAGIAGCSLGGHLAPQRDARRHGSVQVSNRTATWQGPSTTCCPRSRSARRQDRRVAASAEPPARRSTSWFSTCNGATPSLSRGRDGE